MFLGQGIMSRRWAPSWSAPTRRFIVAVSWGDAICDQSAFDESGRWENVPCWRYADGVERERVGVLLHRS